MTDCPWPGPIPYRDQQYRYFAGRRYELETLAGQIHEQWLTALLAGSGVGKTSLLQAGLIPRLREDRLKLTARRDYEIVDTKTEFAGAPFPIVLRDWTALRSLRRPEKYVWAYLKVIEGALAETKDWYGFRLAELLSSTSPEESHDQFSAMRGELAAVEAALSDLKSSHNPATRAPQDELQGALQDLVRHFGSVLIVLDQFEEVLLNDVCAAPALEAVRYVFSAFRPEMRQLVSMRTDFSDKLKPLGLEKQREFRLKPISRRALCDAIEEVASVADVSIWSADSLIRMIETDREADLLVVQGVLQSLYEKAPIIGGVRTIRRILVSDLRAALPEVMGQPFGGILSNWVEDCLASAVKTRRVRRLPEVPGEWKPALDAREQEWAKEAAGRTVRSGRASASSGVAGLTAERSLPVLRRMTANMVGSLVNYADVKRPAHELELRAAAYGNDVGLDRTVAGSGPWHGLSYEVSRSGDSSGVRESITGMAEGLQLLFDETLARLERGGVLKRSGDDLVLAHDGFARPLKRWAESVQKSPAYVLGSMYQTVGHVLDWDDEAMRAIPEIEGGWFQHLCWKACHVHGIDFTGQVISACDFEDIWFDNCTFGTAGSEEGVSIFAGGSLRNCLFEGCKFTEGAIEKCDLSNSLFDRCTLDRTEIVSSDLSGTAFWQSHLAAVQIRSSVLAAAGLGRQTVVRDLRITDCDADPEQCWNLHLGPELYVSGSLELMHCNAPVISVRAPRLIDYQAYLTAGRLGAEPTVGEVATSARIVVDHCEIEGCRFEDIAGLGDAEFDIALSGCAAQGATFRRLAGATVRVSSSALARAVFDKCTMRDWSFTGTGIGRDADCNGMAVVDAKLEGPVTFDNCSLVRVYFDHVSPEFLPPNRLRPRVIDLRGSFVRLVQFDDPSQVHMLDESVDLEDSEVTSVAIVVTPEQYRQNAVEDQRLRWSTQPD